MLSLPDGYVRSRPQARHRHPCSCLAAGDINLSNVHRTETGSSCLCVEPSNTLDQWGKGAWCRKITDSRWGACISVRLRQSLHRSGHAIQHWTDSDCICGLTFPRLRRQPHGTFSPRRQNVGRNLRYSRALSTFLKNKFEVKEFVVPLGANSLTRSA